MTKPVQAALQTLLDPPAEGLWGYRLSAFADCAPGTIYTILHRLERFGWVTSYPESMTPDDRQPRTYWELTELGKEEAAKALEKHRARAERRRLALLRCQ